MRISITGSRAHRVWKCPASAILPQVDEGPRNEPARRRGKQIHAYLERVAAVGVDAALAEQTLDRERAAQLVARDAAANPGENGEIAKALVRASLDDNAKLLALLRALDIDELPTWLATEVAFAWDWKARSARELGRNLDRAYPELGPTENACTLDIVGSAVSHAGLVSDYKSGHSKYPAPDYFGQTLLGGLCARSVYKLEKVALELIHIHDDGTHHKVRRWVGEFELDAFEDEWGAAMELVDHWEAEYAAGRGVNVNEGAHCEYCPAYNQCPAKTALVRQLPAELRGLGIQVGQDEAGAPVLLIERGKISIRSASEMWMAIERIEDVLSRAKQEIIGIAAFEPIPLPDGRVIGRLQTERRALDGRIVAEVLDARYGRQEREATVELECTMDSLRRCVVRNIKPHEKISTKKRDGVFDRVLEDIESKGGIGINSTDSIKPHVPKRLKSG
jgi:hypothetical protein